MVCLNHDTSWPHAKCGWYFFFHDVVDVALEHRRELAAARERRFPAGAASDAPSGGNLNRPLGNLNNLISRPLCVPSVVRVP